MEFGFTEEQLMFRESVYKYAKMKSFRCAKRPI